MSRTPPASLFAPMLPQVPAGAPPHSAAGAATIGAGSPAPSRRMFSPQSAITGRPTLSQARAALPPVADWAPEPAHVRRWLELCGMTYKQAADLLGVGERTISGYCRDRPIPYAVWAGLLFLTAKPDTPPESGAR